MAYAIKSLKIINLHGYLNFDINFNEGLNVILGKNGTGKSTIANITSHLMRGHFHKFLFVEFDYIEFEFFHGDRYMLKKEDTEKLEGNTPHFHGYISIQNISKKTPPVKNKDKICTNNPKESYIQIDYLENTTGKFWYWPANRSIDELEDSLTSKERKYYYSSRGLYEIAYGDFSATSTYKTFNSIEGEIKDKYLKWLSSKTKKAEDFFDNIMKITEASDFPDATSELKSIVDKVDLISKEMDSLAAEHIESTDTFIKKVNAFLNGKNLAVNKLTNNDDLDKGFISLNADDGTPIGYDQDIVYCLSAGERQFIPMLYQAIASIENGCLTVDEPEISLDVEWQAELGSIFSQKKNCQVICFTHSYSFSESFNWGEDTFYLKTEHGITKLFPC